jgi:uncharacterized protein YndB with AHSA1/START domain
MSIPVFGREVPMTLAFTVSAVIQAPAEKIYAAWLDSKGHADMTGAAARVGAEVGEDFEAWDGYIRGKNLILEPGRRIVQAWRTAEFAPDEPDSKVEVTFTKASGGTSVTIRHSNLPAHGMQYKDGWVENYFVPMKKYFEG